MAPSCLMFVYKQARSMMILNHQAMFLQSLDVSQVREISVVRGDMKL